MNIVIAFGHYDTIQLVQILNQIFCALSFAITAFFLLIKNTLNVLVKLFLL